MPLKYTGPSEDEVAPLHEHSKGQTGPQPAFIELDPARGTVRLGTNMETDNGLHPDVWHNRILWWSVPEDLTGNACRQVFDDLAPLLERVAAGHEITWDGNNHVGKLNADAEAASEEIRIHLEDAGERYETANLWDAGEWLWGGNTLESLARALGIEPEMADEEVKAMAGRLEAEAKGDGIVLTGDIEREIQGVMQRLQDLQQDAPVP
jgi:hypothetical protein